MSLFSFLVNGSSQLHQIYIGWRWLKQQASGWGNICCCCCCFCLPFAFILHTFPKHLLAKPSSMFTAGTGVPQDRHWGYMLRAFNGSPSKGLLCDRSLEHHLGSEILVLNIWEESDSKQVESEMPWMTIWYFLGPFGYQLTFSYVQTAPFWKGFYGLRMPITLFPFMLFC